jgi:hypothetical protein
LPPGDWEILSEDELRRRVLRYKGVQPSAKPPIGQKSTILRQYDIAYMSNIDIVNFCRWMKGKIKFGKVRCRRVSRIILLCDAGRVQKLKHKKYIFHDKPFAQPLREMRVNIDLKDGLSLTRGMQPVAPPTLPSFNDVFKGFK